MARLWGSRCRALPARRNRERIYPGCGAADRKGIVAGWGIGVKRCEECWGRAGTACRGVALPEVDVAGQTPVTAPHGWPPQVTVQNDRKAHVCPQPLPAAGAGCWGARRPGAATSMQGWLPPPATANRNGKLSLSACGTSVQTTPQILFFPCSQKNVNFFKQNPNFSSKAKKKNRRRKQKAAQATNLWQSPTILKLHSSAALGEARRPAAAAFGLLLGRGPLLAAWRGHGLILPRRGPVGLGWERREQPPARPGPQGHAASPRRGGG